MVGKLIKGPKVDKHWLGPCFYCVWFRGDSCFLENLKIECLDGEKRIELNKYITWDEYIISRKVLMPILEETLPKSEGIVNKYLCGVAALRKTGVRESLCRLFVAERLAVTHAYPMEQESVKKPKLKITCEEIMEKHYFLLLERKLLYIGEQEKMWLLEVKDLSQVPYQAYWCDDSYLLDRNWKDEYKRRRENQR